ncbi:MAG: creatininase family protein [Jatrophihabitantaceae bacterium]
MTRPVELPILPRTVTTDSQVTEPSVALLPIGSFEQHGPHLPLVTDTLVAAAISHTIAQAHPVRQLPPLTISCSHEHAAFAGTLSISASTLAAIITDITESLHQQGIDRLLIVNGHGGNYVLSNVVQQANVAPGASRMALFPARDDWADARHSAGMTSDAPQDMHAGELETSILLAAYPDYLREGWQHDDHEALDRRQLLTLGIVAYSPTGVIGAPSAATAAKGHAALQRLAENSGKIMRTLNQISPEK